MYGDSSDRDRLLSHQQSSSGISYSSDATYGYYPSAHSRYSTATSYLVPPTPTTPGYSPLKPLNPYQGYIHRKRHRTCGPGCYWPTIVVAGQLFLLAGAWGFYILGTLKSLPLPNPVAKWVRDNPHSVIYIVTAAGTGISLVTGFLYSHAIRYALMMFLSKPVSLYVIASSISMAAQTPVLNVKRWKWTMAGLICAIILGLQTAGWTTLLTPHIIWLKTGIVGMEFNLNDQTFFDTLRSMNRNHSILPDSLNNVFPVVLDSGVVALGASFGMPTALNWNHFSFVESTGGIMPPFFTETRSIVSQNRTLPISAHMGKQFHNPEGFTTNYTVGQQGVTANITCRTQNLDETTVPSLTIRTDWISPMVMGLANGVNSNLAGTWMQIECGDGRMNDTLNPFATGWSTGSIDPNNAIYVGACVDSAGIYEYFFKGTGLYSFLGTTSCRVEPQVTRILMQYIDSSSKENMARLISRLKVVDAQLSVNVGLASSLVLQRAFWFWQGVSSNLWGDAIQSMYIGREDQEDIIPRLLEPFLTGVFEFGATLFRIAFSERPNPFLPEGLSESSYMKFDGSYSAETMGWAHLPGTIPIILFAPTFVMLASIIIIGVTMIKSPGHDGDNESYSFDPYDILQVIGATARGDLTFTKFPDYDNQDEYLATSVDVMVVLKSTDSSPLGLRRTPKS